MQQQIKATKIKALDEFNVGLLTNYKMARDVQAQPGMGRKKDRIKIRVRLHFLTRSHL